MHLAKLTSPLAPAAAQRLEGRILVVGYRSFVELVLILILGVPSSIWDYLFSIIQSDQKLAFYTTTFSWKMQISISPSDWWSDAMNQCLDCFIQTRWNPPPGCSRCGDILTVVTPLAINSELLRDTTWHSVTVVTCRTRDQDGWPPHPCSRARPGSGEQESQLY